MYTIGYTETARKDIPKLKAAHLDGRAKALIRLIQKNPYETPPGYEKLIGDMQGLFCRRINLQNRLIYEVFESEKTIKIISLYASATRPMAAADLGKGRKK